MQWWEYRSIFLTGRLKLISKTTQLPSLHSILLAPDVQITSRTQVVFQLEYASEPFRGLVVTQAAGPVPGVVE